MTAPRIVWAASRGQYSDYRIECLFESEALAEQYVEQENRCEGRYDQYFVEEFDLYSAMPEVRVITHAFANDTYTYTERVRKAGQDYAATVAAAEAGIA